MVAPDEFPMFGWQKAHVQRQILGPRPTLQQWKNESFFMKGQYYFNGSTHLWNTPLNLYQKAKEGFLS